MNTRRLLYRAIQHALMTSAAVATACYASTVLAADANTPAQLSKVTVTGTRIKRTDVETAQPITRINRQQIEQSGYTDLSQLLGQLSFTGVHATTQQLGTTTGINLRNLGENRTLILVNGKRWVQSLGGGTNLETIPTSIIDHIEILQDGASAVYGSDAIAGVVNVITRKDFNGAELHAYYGIHNDHKMGHWDGQIKQYDFTAGSGNERGNVVFNATYREQNSILKQARESTRSPIPHEPVYVGASAATPNGRFRLFGPAVSNRTFGQGTCGTYDPANPTNPLCDLTLQNSPAQPSLQNFRNFRDTDRFPEEPLTSLQAPTKHVSLYAQGHYDLFDNVTFTANAAYVRGEVNHTQPAAPIPIGATNPSTGSSGNKIGISASNPYNPFGVDLVANPSDPCLAAGTCIGLTSLVRRPLEVGARTAGYTRDSFHMFAGFNGYVNLFNHEIDWDVGFAQNRVQGTEIHYREFDYGHIAEALGPAAQCTAPCAPLNFFGGSVQGDGGSITQAEVQYIKHEFHRLHQGNLRDWTADLSSDVYNLPAGPLGLAIGYERVDNYGYTRPDALRASGDAEAGIIERALSGRVARNAEYAELNIPLLKDRPGAKNLSIDIANRWTQFERSGGTAGQTTKSFVHNSSGRLNIRWQAINDLLLRASWSQGFRSPNVSALFGGVSGGFPNVTDPCAGPPYGGYSGGPLPPNCPNGTEDLQPKIDINSIGGSNAGLQPEKSISRTVGFVYSPSQVPGLDANADYFKIELNDTVGTVGVQNIIDGCFYNSSFCDQITTANNQILRVRNVNTNVGNLLTEGIDFGVHYKFPSTPLGDFDARINGTFLKTFDSSIVNLSTDTGFATQHLAGTETYPKRRFNGYLDWNYGNWSAEYHLQYIGAVAERCGVSIEGYCTYPNRTANFQGTPGQFPQGRNHRGATVYHDVHIKYTVPSIKTTFAVGVNNLFDKKPPTCSTCTGYTGGFVYGFYRLPSRLLYGSIRVRF